MYSFQQTLSKIIRDVIFRSSLLVFLFVSCEPNVQNLDLPDQGKYVILECYLTPGYPPELTLTQSNTLDEDLVINNLWYADVSLDIDGVIHPMKNMLYSKPDRRIMVNYRADDTLQIAGNDHFALSVFTRQQETLTATTNTVSPIRITDCRITDSRIDVRYDVEGDDANWLKMGVVLFTDKKISPFIQYFDVKEQAKGVATLLWKRPAAVVDSISVTLFNIQKDYYDYGVSVQNAVSAYHDPFLTPEAIKSNINGGIGIFTYYTSDKKTIRY